MNRTILFSVAAGISSLMLAKNVQAQTSEALDINNINVKIAQSNVPFLPDLFNMKVGCR